MKKISKTKKQTLQYNGENFCKLATGKYEPLYYGNDLKHPRDFYCENGEWYLDHDVVDKVGLIYRHDKIVEFLNVEFEKPKMPPSPLKGKTRYEISRISTAKKIYLAINSFIYVANHKKDVYNKAEVSMILQDIQKMIKKEFMKGVDFK